MKISCTLLLLCCCVLANAATVPSLAKIYSIWYCADDGCGWATEPTLSTNNWLANRGDGTPTVNIVIFSFLDPLQHVVNGVVPPGMTQNAVNWFTSRGIRVIFSIGGEAYSARWNAALQTGAFNMGVRAANIANTYGVGIEIDYEASGSESLLTQFVQGFRSINPINLSNNAPSNTLLTVDLAAGTGYLTEVSLWAANHVGTTLNWANAMVSAAPWTSLSDASFYWNQHLTGSTWNNLPPLAANLMVVSHYASSGAANCPNYYGTVLEGTVGWVQQNGARGISFWAAGCPAPPGNCANNCPGIQTGSIQFSIATSSGVGGTVGSVTSAATTAKASTTTTTTAKAATTTTTTTTAKASTATTAAAATTATVTSGGDFCAGRATGIYCYDTTRFQWCPERIIQSCGAGTVCRQSGNSIICDYP